MREFRVWRQAKKLKGKKVSGKNEKGEKVSFRLHKNVPGKCSTPRQICIRCKKTRIHKLSRLYDLKVCEACGGLELLKLESTQ